MAHNSILNEANNGRQAVGASSVCDQVMGTRPV